MRAAVCGALALAGCGGHAPEPGDARRARAARDVEHYVWVDARCSDGTIDLAATGFERTVELQRREDGYLMTFDTELATQGCRALSVWTAHAERELYAYRFVPEAWVHEPRAGGAPSERGCGPEEREPVLGEIHRAGDTLELVLQRSPWCRGFDAHFVLKGAPPPVLRPQDVVARYVAHFARGDAGALAALFERTGALIEGFSESADGRPTRHEGRAAITAYFERAFAGASWHAARLVSLQRGDRPSEISADVEYIDSELKEPLRVRASFVLAAGEIFESDLQLVTDPQPAEAASPPASELHSERVP